MANIFSTPEPIAKEMLFHLENNCIAGSLVHKEYKNELGKKVGGSIDIRKPVKFVTTTGQTMVEQEIQETTTSLTVNIEEHVAWAVDSIDYTLSVEESAERYFKPAAIALGNYIDRRVCEVGAQGFWNRVGTPGTTPTTAQELSAVTKRLDAIPVPDDGNRNLLLDTDAINDLSINLGLLGDNSMQGSNEGMVRESKLGRIARLNVHGDQNVAGHTAGVFSGTPRVNGTVLNGATSLNFDGMTDSQTGALKAGDTLTIAGTYAVNDVSKIPRKFLQQVLVTADVDTTAGAGTVNFTPALNDGSLADGAGGVQSAAYQNVDALPLDDALITVGGTAGEMSIQNLGFHRNAIALVMLPVELPDSAGFKARMDWNGYSIRVVKEFDIRTNKEYIRMDILGAVKVIYPDIGVRMDG